MFLSPFPFSVQFPLIPFNFRMYIYTYTESHLSSVDPKGQFFEISSTSDGWGEDALQVERGIVSKWRREL